MAHRKKIKHSGSFVNSQYSCFCDDVHNFVCYVTCGRFNISSEEALELFETISDGTARELPEKSSFHREEDCLNPETLVTHTPDFAQIKLSRNSQNVARLNWMLESSSC